MESEANGRFTYQVIELWEIIYTEQNIKILKVHILKADLSE